MKFVYGTNTVQEEGKVYKQSNDEFKKEKELRDKAQAKSTSGEKPTSGHTHKSDTRTCFKCNTIGHIARKCLSFKPWSRNKNEQKVEKKSQPEIVKPKIKIASEVKLTNESMFENSIFEKGESSKSNSNDDSKFYIKKARNMSQSWMAKRKSVGVEKSELVKTNNTGDSKPEIIKSELMKTNDNEKEIQTKTVKSFETDNKRKDKTDDISLEDFCESDFDYDDLLESNYKDCYAFQPKTKKAWVSFFKKFA